MNATADETFEPVAFSNVHEGDRVQFVTNDNGFDGRGLYSRTGRVAKVTEKTVRVVCDDRDIAVLRLSGWHYREVRKAVTEQPARRPYSAENVQYVDNGPIVTAVWVSDPAIGPAEALENSLCRDLPYEMEVIAEATRHFKQEGADFSGWVISRGNDYSDLPIARKRDAVKSLRDWVEGHFER